MRYTLIVFALTTWQTAQGQISFKKVFGDAVNGEYGQAVVQADDSGYYVAGARVVIGSQITGEGQLLRTDKYGNEIWTMYYNTVGSDDLSFDNIIKTSDGNLLMVGTAVYDGTDYNVYVAKADTAGTVLWYRNYEALYRQRGLQVKETTDGGFVIGGWNEMFGTAISNFYMMRTNATGDTLWTRNYPNGMQQYGNAIDQTTDGGFAIVGSIQQPTLLGSTMYIIKTDANGDTLWTRKLDTLNFGKAYDVKAIANNHIIVAGYTTINGCSQPVLLEMDGSGNMLWREIYTDGPCGWAYSVGKTDDGGYAVFGMDATSDLYLVKTDGSGMQEWYRKFHESNTDFGYAASQTSDGGYIMTGITTNTNVGDLILIKVDGNGDLLNVPEAIKQSSLKIFPNPSKNIVYIEHKNGKRINQILVQDVTGKVVYQYAGTADHIDISSLSRGMYLLKITTEDEVLGSKLIVE